MKSSLRLFVFALGLIVSSQAFAGFSMPTFVTNMRASVNNGTVVKDTKAKLYANKGKIALAAVALALFVKREAALAKANEAGKYLAETKYGKLAIEKSTPYLNSGLAYLASFRAPVAQEAAEVATQVASEVAKEVSAEVSAQVATQVSTEVAAQVAAVVAAQ
ncbi:MAG: hypothetical protein P4L22_05400 [Candidatus Babeliales bacterium]|nr:hypothetical protein [Candidatus Babeliales bacterium]